MLALLAAIFAFHSFWNIEKRVAHPMVSTTHMKQRHAWALLLILTLTMTGVFAVMNGLNPNLAQDTEAGAGMSTETVSWASHTRASPLGR